VKPAAQHHPNRVPGCTERCINCTATTILPNPKQLCPDAARMPGPPTQTTRPSGAKRPPPPPSFHSPPVRPPPPSHTHPSSHAPQLHQSLTTHHPPSPTHTTTRDTQVPNRAPALLDHCGPRGQSRAAIPGARVVPHARPPLSLLSPPFLRRPTSVVHRSVSLASCPQSHTHSSCARRASGPHLRRPPEPPAQPTLGH